ncbi:unnamed protein product [Caenorhabditis sp. 36 PRJEB53466]|nr:unnamed protein product [Caenorhabditis sp. 36 PRJEB53466]
MNNLVAYDADSDDESPRRRSSDAVNFAKNAEEKRKRRTSDAYDDDEDVDVSPRSETSDGMTEFVEPPPPKRERDDSASPAAFRTPQMAMPHTSSQASLVSYSGDGDDDDQEMNGKLNLLPESTPASELHEPAPPIRQSEDSESDEEQKLIDLAIREGNAAMSRRNEQEGAASPADSETPGREMDSMQILEEDTTEELRIPPPPDVEVNPAIVARFEHAFRQKAGGTDLNQQIQGNQQYNNPMSYTTFIEAFDIDEKGTNFARNIFDPHCFPENCFYDAIAEEQRKLEPVKKSSK